MAERRDDERIARELADDLRRLRVEDLVLQLLVTISSTGYRRLGVTADSLPDRDLGQVRLAIAAIDALVPVLEGAVPDELLRDVRQSVSHLKLSYAEAVRADAPS